MFNPSNNLVLTYYNSKTQQRSTIKDERHRTKLPILLWKLFPHGRLLVIGITFREILCCQFQSGETKIKTWQDWVRDAKTSLWTKINFLTRSMGYYIRGKKGKGENLYRTHYGKKKVENFGSNVSSCRTYHGYFPDLSWCPNPSWWLAGSSVAAPPPP